MFEDAITFKIALMVVKYMKYMESLEYWNCWSIIIRRKHMIELKDVTKEYSKGVCSAKWYQP